MANHLPLLRLISIYLIALVWAPASSGAGRSSDSTAVNAQAISTTADTGQRLWCVAKPATPDKLLQANLNFACGEGGVDCTPLLEGNACYSPDTLISHASYAMNLYYQKHGRNYWNCYFQNTGLVVFTDPSYDNCIYPPQ
ncbi:hypothetical protein KP509_27G011500 [Ceratopteris richardii]|uniref:X8 domain-containing protein n=1 Tax=Ceratopteris richardii TaxID=49495 RepID=A0A8T2RFB9_CERRI|nr:hypothetical protein KP509_27G011500 [Ceratopteris richardii]